MKNFIERKKALSRAADAVEPLLCDGCETCDTGAQLVAVVRSGRPSSQKQMQGVFNGLRLHYETFGRCERRTVA